MKKLLAFLCFLLTLSCTKEMKYYESFEPGKEWSDTDGNKINAHAGGILYYNDTYYWFGQIMTDAPSPIGSNAQIGVSCYSSKDLYSWKNEGVALSVVDDTTHLLARGCKIERPKVIYNQKTNKFVMWWHHDLLGDGHKNALTGVAVSDHVNGPYILRSVFRPNSWNWPINVKSYHKEEIPSTTLDFYSGGELPSHPDSLNLLGRDYEKGQMSRDMTLFVDDDGTAYHIYSSEENSTLHISQLTDDYLTYSGKYSRFFIGRFMEAPAMFKKNDKYYLIMSGCTGWLPNSGRSAVASSIWGPWVELGNPFVGDNAGISFDSQGTFVLPSPSRKDEFIYIGDRWTPEQADNATYIWLPIRFEGIKPVIEWKDRWRY